MSERAPILFLSAHHGTGASETLWIETALSLHQHGVPVRAMVAWRKQDTKRVAALTAQGIRVDFLAPVHTSKWRRLLARAVSGQTQSLWSFRKLIKQQKPAFCLISQGNTNHDVPAVVWMEECQRLGIPFSVVTHGYVPFEWPSDAIIKRVREGYEHARRTYWVAQQNRRDAELTLGTSLANGAVVWNPVRWPREKTVPWPVSTGFRIATVGRLQVRSKGLDLLLQALATDVWRDRDWALTMFGDGENREGLKQLIQHLGLGKKVTLAGHVAGLDAIWADQHLLLQPSRFEGMPLSIIEAMMAGRPVLATNVAGHGEVIEDNVTGFLAKNASVSDLNEALDRAWQHREQLPAMGAAAAASIRRLVPEDPAAAFAAMLREDAA